MSDDDPRRYLGRGYVPIAGRPFGYAFNMERAAIREHLKARGRWHSARDEREVSRIQDRLNREHPKRWAARQAAWRARCAAASPPAPEPFTNEELRRLVDLFAGANDPVTVAIAAKAQAMLDAAGRLRD